MAHGTFKPCPGCKQEQGYRGTNDVCDDCQALLRVGRAVTQEQEAQAEKGVLFRLTEEWPTFYIPSGEPETGAKLRRAFEKLARTGLRAARSKSDPYMKGVEPLPPTSDLCHYFSTYDPRASLWTGTRRLAEAITELDLQVRKALSRAREIGEEDGKNFIMQIAQGKLSMNDLTEATIEAGYRNRKPTR
jgi:hypothetical protein